MVQKPHTARVDRRARRRMIRNAADKRLRVVARLHRIFGFLTIAAAILFFAANMSLFSKESLRQIGTYLTAGFSAGQAGDRIEYEAGNSAAILPFGDGVAVADNDNLVLKTPGGTQLTEPLGYSSPELCVNDRYVLVYDREGSSAVLTSSMLVAGRQKLESPILSGCLGDSGDYALITNETGYKSAVTVFSSGGKQIFKWATPDAYFQAAALSPDGKGLAVAAFQQTGTELEGKLYFRDLDSEEIISEVSLGSVVPLAVGYLDGSTVAVVGDYSTSIINRKGEIITTISYSVDDLNAYCFGGGKLALAIHSYSGQARSELTILEASGAQSEPLAIEEELQAIDYDGARLALLTSSGLTVYDSALRPLWANTSAAGAGGVGLTGDGGVWLTYPKQATFVSAASDTSEELK